MSEVCPDCGAPFADKSDLVIHVRKEHGGGDPVASLGQNPYSRDPTFVCILCGARFATAEELARHDLAPHPHPRRGSRRNPARAGSG